ncbi:MAG: flippase [Muribaculaceae bacterium]|nr:flippase [Muribaculaceae bacterium]
MSDIKKNFIYKVLLTFSNYILGFVTLPYITRVLGPEKFGEVNFVMNTVDYFILFASMGVMTIGTREIAMNKESRPDISRVASDILALNLAFTGVVLLIYNLSVLIVPSFGRFNDLFWIGNAKILFWALLVEWFFTGIENFRYITIRSLIIKTLYVGLVFIFVKTTKDYKLYFILTVLSFVVNAVVNFGYYWKQIGIQFKKVNLKKYLKPNLKLGTYTIMTSMYITFNVIFLGMVSDMNEVGYYSASLKLYFVILSIFSAFTGVMLPRMAAIVNSGDKSQFFDYLNKSYHLVFLFAFPILFVSLFLAPEIIGILAGNGYKPAVAPMRILMCALPFVWLSQVISVQGLAAIKKDSILLWGAIIGALCSLIINVCLTPSYGAVGSSIVLVASECCVTLFSVLRVRSLRLFPLPSVKMILSYLLCSLPIIIVGACAYWIDNIILRFIIIGLTGSVVAAFTLLGFRRRMLSN